MTAFMIITEKGHVYFIDDHNQKVIISDKEGTVHDSLVMNKKLRLATHSDLQTEIFQRGHEIIHEKGKTGKIASVWLKIVG